jgi:hypothetical protein
MSILNIPFENFEERFRIRVRNHHRIQIEFIDFYIVCPTRKLLFFYSLFTWNFNTFWIIFIKPLYSQKLPHTHTHARTRARTHARTYKQHEQQIRKKEKRCYKTKYQNNFNIKCLNMLIVICPSKLFQKCRNLISIKGYHNCIISYHIKTICFDKICIFITRKEALSKCPEKTGNTS